MTKEQFKEFAGRIASEDETRITLRRRKPYNARRNP